MKKDLTTSIITAIITTVIAFLACNMLLPSIQDFSFKSIDDQLNYSLQDPNPEVFNYRAVNPTVEVYVGQCAEYNENGECIEKTTLNEDTDNQNSENSTDNTNDSDSVTKQEDTTEESLTPENQDSETTPDEGGSNGASD